MKGNAQCTSVHWSGRAEAAHIGYDLRYIMHNVLERSPTMFSYWIWQDRHQCWDWAVWDTRFDSSSWQIMPNTSRIIVNFLLSLALLKTAPPPPPHHPKCPRCVLLFLFNTISPPVYSFFFFSFFFWHSPTHTQQLLGSFPTQSISIGRDPIKPLWKCLSVLAINQCIPSADRFHTERAGSSSECFPDWWQTPVSDAPWRQLPSLHPISCQHSLILPSEYRPKSINWSPCGAATQHPGKSTAASVSRITGQQTLEKDYHKLMFTLWTLCSHLLKAPHHLPVCKQLEFGFFWTELTGLIHNLTVSRIHNKYHQQQQQQNKQRKQLN